MSSTCLGDVALFGDDNQRQSLKLGEVDRDWLADFRLGSVVCGPDRGRRSRSLLQGLLVHVPKFVTVFLVFFWFFLVRNEPSARTKNPPAQVRLPCLCPPGAGASRPAPLARRPSPGTDTSHKTRECTAGCTSAPQLAAQLVAQLAPQGQRLRAPRTGRASRPGVPVPGRASARSTVASGGVLPAAQLSGATCGR